jgi:hypothetical protein
VPDDHRGSETAVRREVADLKATAASGGRRLAEPGAPSHVMPVQMTRPVLSVITRPPAGSADAKAQKPVGDRGATSSRLEDQAELMTAPPHLISGNEFRPG